MSFAGKSDFRSDTVTRPTPEMYEAMVSAPTGDDVFGDDPSVIALEELAAELFGKEGALFVPSGTMANQIACRTHCNRDAEILLEATSHIFLYEQGGLAQLSGIQGRTVVGDRGVMDLDELASLVRGDDPHFPVTEMLALENTHNSSGGSILPFDYMLKAREFTLAHNLRLHIDGARICNAEAATGISLAEYAAQADSISCCLSKGLAAPVGTVLAGEADFIRQARRTRKLFGGGMRQAGVIAAAGTVALRDMRVRLKDDHARAKRLADGLNSRDGFSVVAPETNLVYVSCPGRARAFEEACAAADVMTLALNDDTLRFVTHKDIDDSDINRVLEVPFN
ncbi:MAG: threonine aldolase [Planctomycetota bacterium]|jgi:threonine aldolase